VGQYVGRAEAAQGEEQADDCADQRERHTDRHDDQRPAGAAGDLRRARRCGEGLLHERIALHRLGNARGQRINAGIDAEEGDTDEHSGDDANEECPTPHDDAPLLRQGRCNQYPYSDQYEESKERLKEVARVLPECRGGHGGDFARGDGGDLCVHVRPEAT
jgi:hypothetical protein